MHLFTPLIGHCCAVHFRFRLRYALPLAEDSGLRTPQMPLHLWTNKLCANKGPSESVWPAQFLPIKSILTFMAQGGHPCEKMRKNWGRERGKSSGRKDLIDNGAFCILSVLECQESRVKSHKFDAAKSFWHPQQTKCVDGPSEGKIVRGAGENDRGKLQGRGWRADAVIWVPAREMCSKQK